MPGGRSRGFPGEARPRVGRVARLQPRAPMSTGCPWSESAARRAGARVVRLRLFVRLSGWQARETNVVGAVGVGVCNPSARYSRVVTFSCVGASLPRLVSVCVYTFLFPALLDFAVRCKRLFFGCVWAFCSCFGLVWF